LKSNKIVFFYFSTC